MCWEETGGRGLESGGDRRVKSSVLLSTPRSNIPIVSQEELSPLNWSSVSFLCSLLPTQGLQEWLILNFILTYDVVHVHSTHDLMQLYKLNTQCNQGAQAAPGPVSQQPCMTSASTGGLHPLFQFVTMEHSVFSLVPGLPLSTVFVRLWLL